MVSAPFVSPARLREFFNPRSIALLGASDRNDMSRQVHEGLRRNSFAGTVHYVNPNSPVVHGERTVPSLDAVDGPIDMLYVLYGGDRVVDAVEQAAKRGTRNVVVLSGGFGETVEGAARQRRLIEVAHKHEVALLGPNTIGFINATDHVVAYGSPGGGVPQGSVGLAAQSGVLLAATVSGLTPRGVGFSTLAGVANEAVISLDHMIDYFVEDPATQVIGIYMETTRDPEAFRRAASRALEAGKPIVALTAGRTEVTVDMAVSHTGAIVGDQKVKEAALEELGVISVRSLEEYLATLALLANHGVMPGRRLAYLSVSGGVCEMFADLAIEAGLNMPKLQPETVTRLTEILPAISTPKNPLDVTGVAQTDVTIIPKALEVLTKDPNLDIVVFNDFLPGPDGVPDLAAAVAASEPYGAVVRRSTKPLLPASLVYSDPPAAYRDIVEQSGKGYEIGGAAHGVFAIEKSCWWRETRERFLARGGARALNDPSRKPEAREVPDRGRGLVWTEARSLDLLESAGVPVMPWRVCVTRDEVLETARQFGFPLVAKVSSPDIAHKSRVGGVVLGIADEDAAIAAFDQVRSRPLAHVADARIEGALITPQRDAGIDLIVGLKRDETWGLVLAIGLGGVWTEVLQDVSLVVLPTTEQSVEDALNKLRGSSILDGGHGLAPVDRKALARTILKVAELGQSLGDALESLEVNPLRAHGTTIEALDGLISWTEPSTSADEGSRPAEDRDAGDGQPRPEAV
ncbi:acetate--CoA ligase family protein [Nocardioides sp. 1609]|uniref:acetate--CoA ligase family protein n=1 Tax=Nocardioides sp. 1609 TaxID=2508327 RepID=UPI00106FE435|nr:acetate--CoA ligase family protein [Nocardioides sp. 1609]